jgi:hypothetical protein
MYRRGFLRGCAAAGISVPLAAIPIKASPGATSLRSGLAINMFKPMEFQDSVLADIGNAILVRGGNRSTNGAA